MLFTGLTVLFWIVGGVRLPERPPLGWPDSISISIDSAAPMDRVIVSVGELTPGTTVISVVAIPADESAARGDLTIKMITYGGPTTTSDANFEACTSDDCVAVNPTERDFRTSWGALSPLSLVETGAGPVRQGVQVDGITSGARFGYVTNDVDLRALLPAVYVKAPGSDPVTVVRRLNEFSNAWSFEWNSDAHIDNQKIIGDAGRLNVDVAALTWPATLVLEGGSGVIDEYRAVARNPSAASSDADSTFQAGIFLGIAGAALIVAVDAALLAWRGSVQESGAEAAHTPTPPKPTTRAPSDQDQAARAGSGAKRGKGADRQRRKK